ncbi:MAG TPA: ISNCY family transposase, partial [Anaerolineae bacterium]|nr:ISNCY family transposase [Anaerolineae bacterium]
MPEPFNFDTLMQSFHPILDRLPDHRTGQNVTYTIKDAALSAFAVFFMQSPSFLAQQQTVQRRHGRNNAQSLFGVAQIPSDNQIRNLLDPLQPELLFPLFATCWQTLEAAGVLTPFQAINQNRL